MTVAAEVLLAVRFYERDEALDSRGQGYRLHLDAGPALHSCLPPDLYRLCVATAGRPSTSVTVVTKRLRQVRHFAVARPADPFDPETLNTSVNRQTFREILAARLNGVIRYGSACTGFAQDGDGVRAYFADGSSAEGDVLIGADGVGSPVRRQYLPHAQVTGTGSVRVYGRTPLTDQSRPLIPDYLWRGFTAVIGRGVGMAAGLTAWALHQVALDTIRHWHRDMRRLVELATAEETMLVPVRTSVPVRRWPASRVTLLGDAIHAMSPARGSGANTALRDAALLAAELGAAARGAKPVLSAVVDYERAMTDYGFAAVLASQRAGRASRPV
jgi:2-polyprenyl-6-methoxyphenol hydroxylase-like FAD-dependent oxidoreductase